MNIDAMRQRLAALKASQTQLTKAIEQAQANLQATGGAIQECEHWLAQLTGSAEPPRPELVKPAKKKGA
jgi:LmbE family N-acetylglucosaminyl deacetylase